MNTKFLISVAGPTAIGKTALSIKLANAFNTHIISADSRQFYREMQIGTAAPGKEELEAAPHHFIHHISINDNYSVGDFEREAIDKINDLFKDHSVLIVTGGSGLYLKSIFEGLDDFPEVDTSIREELNYIHEDQGLLPLQEKLKILDPQTYLNIDLENPHRVIRALEICMGTGKPYSSFLKREKPDRDFSVIKIGLTAPREEIYSRINKRVDIMMEEGLLEEARRLLPFKDLNALNTVGYKELFAYFEGKCTVDEAVEEIKKNTRRFAKRQLTWFRKEEGINWFEHTTPINKILEFLSEKLSLKR
ncbi:MAG TPA: tRNA (adenosine(37)-N6)-dimethylallyltransferase MiaA [Gillisia sp.]|nr:tRNA (adenosine(37)-N6)-dimethylallyltransferase MiaA [Gillisia sp.]